MFGVSKVINTTIFLSILFFFIAGLLKFNQGDQTLYLYSDQPETNASIEESSEDETPSDYTESPIRQDSPAKFRSEGNTLYYYGEISGESWDNFQSFVADIETKNFSRMIINSGGGDTRYGRKLGRWVKENIDVIEVEGGCFSSCANYVFPAAREKRIQEGAFVGWHGSEAQYDVLALSQPDQTGMDIYWAEIAQAFTTQYPDIQGTPEMEAEITNVIQQARESLLDEQEFFKELGLDGQFAIYGLMPAHLTAYEASDKHGWGFTIADMEKLGLGKITYLSERRYEESENFRKYLQLLSVKP